MGYGGAIIHTIDGGATWNVQNSGTTDPLHVVLFLDSMHGWIGSNNTVLYTTDGGATWNRGAGILGSITGLGFTDLNNGFAAEGVTVIFRTRDGGRTWTQVQVPIAVSSFRFFDANRGVAVGAGVLHTRDGGNTWTRQPGSTIGGFFINPAQGWNIINNTDQHTVDGGSTWTPQLLPSSAWIYGRYFTDSLNGWAVGAQQNIIHTTDGGTTWTTQMGGINSGLSNAYSFEDVHFADTLHGIAVGDNGLLFTTNDAGTTWTNRESGGATETLGITGTDANHLWAAQTFGEVLSTTDGGQHWSRVNIALANYLVYGVSFIDNLNGWAVASAANAGEGLVFHSSDGGKTWTQQTSRRQLYAIKALSASTVVAVGGDSFGPILVRSTDGGATWTENDTLSAGVLYGLTFVNATTGWAVGQFGTVIKTTDAGKTWVPQVSGVDPAIPLLAVSFADTNNGWVVGDGGAIIHTTDGGSHWFPQTPPVPNNFLAVFAVSPSVAWISGYNTIARTLNGGQTWQTESFVTTLPTSFSGLYFLDADNGWAGGFSGIFRRSLDSTPGVVLKPAALNFGKQLPNATSAAHFATLTNSGVAPLSISSIVATGNFAQNNNCPLSPATLAPEVSCTLSVTFKPAQINNNRGAIAITSNAPGSPDSLPLTGIGTVATVSPTGLNFGGVIVGNTSSPLGTTLKNNGPSPLTLGAISLAGANRADFHITGNTCTGTLASQATCAVAVTFSPAAVGPRQAHLSISHNGGGSPALVSLAGTGQ